MVSLTMLVLLVVIVGVVVATTRQRVDAAGSRPIAPDAGPDPLGQALDDWVAAGLLTHEQRTAILAHELARSSAIEVSPAPERPQPRRVPAVAEALGYLGGMLAVIGLGLVVGQYWANMATAGRLALTGVATALLLVGGATVQEQSDPALVRLRSFLWLAATAASAVFAMVAAADGMGVEGETVVLVIAATVAALSGLLWRGKDRPVQELTTLGGVAVASGALMSEIAPAAAVGVTVWLVGAAVLAFGLRRVLTAPFVDEAVGAVAAVAGSIILANDVEGLGLLLVVATALTLLGLAIVDDLAPAHSDRVLLGAIGGLTLVQGVPGALGYYAQDAAGVTGLVTWAAGGLLVAIGARRMVRQPVAAELLGAAALLGGAALTAAEWEGFGPLFGTATAIGLVGLGMLPGQVLLSVLGSVGLLGNVPWAISWFFPGEGRAPLLIMVSGALIIGVAVMLSRMGDRLRRDLGSPRGRWPRQGSLPSAHA